MGRIFRNHNEFNFAKNPQAPQVSKSTQKRQQDIKKEASWGIKPLKSGISNSNKMIFNSGDGTQSNTTHSGNYIGRNTGNSIFSPDNISKLASQKGSDQIVKQRKDEIKANRDNIRQSSLGQMAQSIKSAQQMRNSISSTSPMQGNASGKKFSDTKISIFDNGKDAFASVPQKTQGQKIRDRNRTEKQKDNTWRGLKPQTRAQSTLFNDLFKDIKKK